MRIFLPVHGCQRFSARRRNLQHLLGKWPILLALAAAVCSCTVPPASPQAFTATNDEHAPPGWSGDESSAYRRGHSDGSHDKRENRRYAPNPARVPAPLSDPYLRGYKDGYRNANDNPWSGRRAYELGHSHGRRDRVAGQPMSPDKHVGEVPRAVRDEFRRGYREGWE